MLPLSYFSSVHKIRQAGVQNQRTKRKRDEVDEGIDVSIENSSHWDDNESCVASCESEILSSTFASPQVGRHGNQNEGEPSEPPPEVDDNSVYQPRKSKRSSSRSVLDGNLAKLQPPLLSPPQYLSSGLRGSQDMRVSGARQHHLAVLTTILHRSLLQYDYLRAGRAWGMILRSELDGHSMDLRNGFRWGLGAEILLQQLGQLPQRSNQSVLVPEVNGGAADDPDQRFNTVCFEKVKQYYERLSLQYPYHKSFPDSIGPLDFRFAMFGLWIFTCTHQQESNSNNNQSVSYTARRESEQQGTESSSKEALQQAAEVSEQLDELMLSPPYSDSARFNNLKYMIDLWKADLAVASTGEGSSATSNIHSAGSN